MRKKAIYKALYHGILPYWCYEDVKHYDCSYWQHFIINLKYAWRWVTFKEDESDVEFERHTNGSKYLLT